MNKYWTSLASLLGALAFFQSLLNSLFPPQLRHATARLYHRISKAFSNHCYFDITETNGVNTNELYDAVQLYLTSSPFANQLSLTRPPNSSSLAFGLSRNDTIPDTFQGVRVEWDHLVSEMKPTTSIAWKPMPDEKRRFVLRVKKKDKTLVLGSYLNHVMDRAEDIRRRNEERYLYTNSASSGGGHGHGYPWDSVPFKHPSTFETLAMDPEKKREIMEDLEDFKSGKGFYENAGRAWKRGYLLYGPPGTGKSSLIAAMANFLGYDIYDLELTEVKTNSELRMLLMKTRSKSIIVIEDIDCSIDLENRNKTSTDSHDDHWRTSGKDKNAPKSITLSGLLNFTDGLWSCCGSERIFVFTTNHVEKLDPALLRSGRMDMHIHMSYCSFPALKILLKNYLGYQEGGLDDHVDDGVAAEVERVIEKARITPADVSEVLIKNKRHKDRAMGELLEELKRRVERNLRSDTNEEGEGEGEGEAAGGDQGLEGEEEEGSMIDC